MSERDRILDPAELEFLLEKGSGSAPKEAPEQGLAAQTVTMRGDLDQINLSDIFQTLSMSKLEGVLVVSNPLEQRQLYFRDGYVQILVPPRTLKRRIGQLLVGAGLLSPDHLRSALVEQRKTDQPLGEILVQNGLVAQEQFDELLGQQITEDLFALFTWQHGTFEFYKGKVEAPHLQAAFEQCAQYEISSLLLEVARRSDEWESILTAILSLEELPQRLSDQPPTGKWVTELHQATFAAVDGRGTYRDVADLLPQTLFDVARAARDLVRQGCLGNVADDTLVAAAADRAELGDKKKALMLLQTLRDRSGSRDAKVLERAAAVLRALGESRLAGTLLIEAAQCTDDPQRAMDLARAARAAAPRDAETISYLRTVLIAHGSGTPAELEQVTVELLDALLDAGKTEAAYEIVADARATGTAQPEILVREARLLHKDKQPQRAAQVLFELGTLYRDAGNRARAIEVLESAYRLDRSHKDVQKLLQQLRQTSANRLVRVGAAALCTLLITSMGVVYWRQNAYESNLRSASDDIDRHLEHGDLAAAETALQRWRGELGESEVVEDLARRVEFAVAAEANRQRQLVRQALVARLEEAAQRLARGELAAALQTYAAAATDHGEVGDVAAAVRARLQALGDELRKAERRLAGSMPGDPDPIAGEADLQRQLEQLQAAYPDQLADTHAALQRLATAGDWPEVVPEPLRDQLAATARDTAPTFRRAAGLVAAYRTALDRQRQNRRLDPLFKAAVAHEQAFEFRAALDLYRTLEKEPTAEVALRSHFREMVARYATITRLCDALAAATAAGDFPAAQQHYRALLLAYPEIPFARLVELPLRVDSVPAGASVTKAGSEVGRTPCVVPFVPAEDTALELLLPGFVGVATRVTGDQRSAWSPTLTLAATQTLELPAVVESPMVDDGRGGWLAVDRSGTVFATDDPAGPTRWRHQTGDLSGLLTQPVVHGDSTWIGSIDGELRNFATATGELRHRFADLATERRPVCVGERVLVATLDGRLVAIDPRQPDHRQVRNGLPVVGNLLATPSGVLLATSAGELLHVAAQDLATLWSIPLGPRSEVRLATCGEHVYVRDDQRRLQALSIATGKPSWRHDSQHDLLDGPLVVGDQVVVTTSEELLRFDRRTGAALPSLPKPGAVWLRGAVACGELLLAPAADGQVHALRLRDGQRVYLLAGSKRGATISPFGGGAVVTTAERQLATYPKLP